MGLVVCQDCRHEVSDLAEACPQCGRPMGIHAPQRSWAFELAAVLGVFGIASIAYSLIFREDLVVNEARVKFWFGYQLVAIAVAFIALGWWKRAWDERGG